MAGNHAGLTSLALLAALSFGCDNTAQGMKKDAEENKRAAAQKVQEAQPAIDEAVERAKAGAQQAGQKAGDLGGKVAEEARDGLAKARTKADEAAPTLDAAKQHLDVKAALMADRTLDASHIDVDVDAASRTLFLRGSVPGADQRAAAERIAQGKADGFTVKNELRVVAK